MPDRQGAEPVLQFCCRSVAKARFGTPWPCSIWPVPDLADDLERIARHIPHLEAAAADESAPPAARAAVVVELAAWRMALNLAGQDRTVSDTPHRTEATSHGR